MTDYVAVLRTKKEYISGLKNDLYKILRVRAIVLVVFFSYFALFASLLFKSFPENENGYLSYFQLSGNIIIESLSGLLLIFSTILIVLLLVAFAWKYLARTGFSIDLINRCNTLLRETMEQIARLQGEDYPESDLEELEYKMSVLSSREHYSIRLSRRLHNESETLEAEIDTLLYDTKVGGSAALALIFISTTLIIRESVFFILIMWLSSLIVGTQIDEFGNISGFESITRAVLWVVFLTSFTLFILVGITSII